MKQTIKHKFYKSLSLFALAGSLVLTGCEKYLDGTQLPAGTIGAEDVYVNDNMASTVVTGMYMNLTNTAGYGGGTGSNLGYILALYTDEAKSTLSGNFADIVYKNAIQSSESPYWSAYYKMLFVANAAIKGINDSPAKLQYKDQWLGETYFLRALFYFYLVNLYGPVPLALSTDYTVNNRLSRAPAADVYDQIVADLKLAQSMLPADYRNGYGAATTSRVRPNSAAATALLARVYLYMGEWAKAEAQATAVISNQLYDTVSLDKVFIANSKETVWSVAPKTASAAYEFSFYNNGMPATIMPPQGPNSFNVYSTVSDQLLNAFESGDRRFNEWLRVVTIPASGMQPTKTLYFPAKFKSSANNAEYQVPLRLAEQYLIRAEARAMQDKGNAAEDLNVVRSRAGLPAVQPATKTALLTAIARERQTELFSEYGHRFFDLKRTGKLDEVMTAVAPAKPTTWKSYMANWPIPPGDILSNPNLTPNPGYAK
ncbi:RagB/SusD family nutrient uptake outer membrane protein [Chitinophaga oryzae]|uniref:RagB/SusD family nutrient uptake outer membrane protein n=1 Tax=Chitinophaga oryzae TaxID=2725414 RepID=A0ABX6LBD2_9BACT|nr:RagB/SusD family nutrient uptake outer membrane protein [Chitinophaga oryzae]QJB37428.1 RagB/SusD family nutrient uptake outer membrane protein [Chitinophaga oryzae]